METLVKSCDLKCLLQVSLGHQEKVLHVVPYSSSVTFELVLLCSTIKVCSLLPCCVMCRNDAVLRSW